MFLRTAAICSIAMGGISQVAAASDTAPPASGPRIERLEPALDVIVSSDAKFEKLAGGFRWAEGPVWDAKNQCLYFSDVRENVVWRWNEKKGVERFLEESGIAGKADVKEMLGSNGLVLDAKGRLVLCQHGNRAVARLEPDGKRTVLADRFEGKRFNSPNDLIYHRNGDLYFTDPAFGLKEGLKSRDAELDFTGVYRLKPDGKVELLVRDIMPNGIGFSPDFRTLFITNDRRLMAFSVGADGTLSDRREFFALPDGVEGAFDGLKVDANGNVYAANWKDGVLVFDPKGKQLGTLHNGGMNANCGFGGPDGQDFFITAANSLYRVRLKARGMTLAKE